VREASTGAKEVAMNCENKEEANPTWLAYTMYTDPLDTVSFA